MPFYKCTLRAGHAGGGGFWELTVYIGAKSYTDAMKQARWFPAVQHNRSNTIVDMIAVDEKAYVLGSIVSGYIRRNDIVNPECFVMLKNVVKRFKNFKVGKLETEEGKTLQNFVNRYSKASEEDKPAIEQEYYNWAQDLLNQNQMTI